MARLRGSAGRRSELPPELLPWTVADWVRPGEVDHIDDHEERVAAARWLAYQRWSAARLKWLEVYGGLSRVELARWFPADQLDGAVTADGLLNGGARWRPGVRLAPLPVEDEDDDE